MKDNKPSNVINSHFLWHYEAFGNTGSVDKVTVHSAMDNYLKQKNWYAVLTCLNILEEIDPHMSQKEKGMWHSMRGVCYSELYEASEPGGSKEVFAREAQRQFDEADSLLGTVSQRVRTCSQP